MHWLSLGSIRNSCDVFYSMMGNMYCVENPHNHWFQFLSEVDVLSLSCWPIFLKIDSKRELKVWSNLSGEETVFTSDFCPWQNDCHIILIFTQSPATECATLKTYFGFPTFVLSAKLKHCQSVSQWVSDKGLHFINA